MRNRYTLANLLITTPPEWKDITDDVDDESAPFTIAKDSGVGALQFSVAAYRGGKLPAFTLSDLDEMRHEFASDNGFSKPFDETISKNKVMVSGGSYRADEDLVRVWYCSDGRDVALVTYVADWNNRGNESGECDGIVSSLEFLRKAKSPKK
jgi:hypothetical protein